MKIVTAWHRGSVATGDKIRVECNNKRRLFSYSLVLLLSICALGGAQGAKLCRKNAFAGVNSGAYSIKNKIWAAGTGCGQSGYGNTDGKRETITDPALLCGTGTRIVSGKALCRPGTEWHYFGAFSETGDESLQSEGEVCWCRVTWPFTSPWIPIMTNASGCAANCNIRCALQDHGLRTAFFGV